MITLCENYRLGSHTLTHTVGRLLYTTTKVVSKVCKENSDTHLTIAQQTRQKLPLHCSYVQRRVIRPYTDTSSAGYLGSRKHLQLPG